MKKFVKAKTAAAKKVTKEVPVQVESSASDSEEEVNEDIDEDDESDDEVNSDLASGGDESDLDDEEASDEEDALAPGEEEASDEEEVSVPGEKEASDEENELDLGASSGEDESDDDGEDDSEDDEKDDDKKVPFDTPKSEAKNNILAKFEKLKGKQLYIRFPKKITENVDELLALVKTLCKRIVKVNRPRQRSANYCTVDFKSIEDRNKGLEELKNATFENNKLFVSIPKTEDNEYVQKIADLHIKNKKIKAAKNRLKKLAKKQSKTFTASILVTNIPATSTVADIKELFPESVNIRFTHTKNLQSTSMANVQLQTPHDASIARKRKLKIDENELKIKFSGLKKKKSNKNAEANGDKPSKPLKRKANDGPAASKLITGKPAAKKSKVEKPAEKKLKVGKPAEKKLKVGKPAAKKINVEKPAANPKSAVPAKKTPKSNSAENKKPKGKLNNKTKFVKGKAAK